MPKPVRLASIDDLDRRSAAYRRAKAAMARIIADLGGDDALTELQRQLVSRVAALSAMCEAVESAWMAGEQVSLGEYAAATGHLRRHAESLGMARTPTFANANRPDLTGPLIRAIRAAKGRRA